VKEAALGDDLVYNCFRHLTSQRRRNQSHKSVKISLLIHRVTG